MDQYTTLIMLMKATESQPDGRHLSNWPIKSHYKHVQIYTPASVQFGEWGKLSGRVSTHGMKGHQINHTWYPHWVISQSSQCSTTGVTKPVVCTILSGMMCIIAKNRLKSGRRFSFSFSEWSLTLLCQILYNIICGVWCEVKYYLPSNTKWNWINKSNRSETMQLGITVYSHKILSSF